MKKFIIGLIGVMFVSAMAFSLSSCSKEEVEPEKEEVMVEYTLAIAAVRGSLSEAEYTMLSQANNEQTVLATSDSNAKSIMNSAFNSYDLTESVNILASTLGKSDFGYDITLTRKSNGKLIHKIKIRPTI